ncbi:hypothetical protein [Luteibacter aegosomatissinici]|uniref:hypothetical protein n=1 Tax=Luteibacter aegosomatissinici TaxID=2911539 RepID=UPI001FF89618|nr:hypothetical protein [Luteibacter aegosomatissinici]UPG95816.1 hypothetical protein L2Y97_06815 [Luteibacter aegosomatissinici]
MNIKNISKPVRSYALKACLTAALTVTCSLHTDTAKAGMPVIDYTAISQAAINFQKELLQWGKTLAHYGQVMQHYTEQAAFWQQQLNKLQSLDLDLFQLEQNFTTIDQNYGVDIMCPGASSSIIDKVTSSLTSLVNPNSDVLGQQKTICANIVRTENRKYNDTVLYLQSLRKQTDNFLQITAMRLTQIGNSPGNTEGLTQETERYSANMELAKTKWESSMQQYDIQLNLLKQQQTVLARRALNGQDSVWGQVVNTVALKIALTGNQ